MTRLFSKKYDKFALLDSLMTIAHLVSMDYVPTEEEIEMFSDVIEKLGVLKKNV